MCGWGWKIRCGRVADVWRNPMPNRCAWCARSSKGWAAASPRPTRRAPFFRSRAATRSHSERWSVAGAVAGLIVMQAGRARCDRQARAIARAIGQRPVPAFFRSEDDVADIGGDQLLAFDQELL